MREEGEDVTWRVMFPRGRGAGRRSQGPSGRTVPRRRGLEYPDHDVTFPKLLYVFSSCER